MPSKADEEKVAEFCRSIIDSPKYRKNLQRRAELGELPAGIEALMFHYAVGKPTDKAEIKAQFSVVDVIRRLDEKKREEKNAIEGTVEE